MQVNLFLAVLKFQLAAATSLLSKVVTSHAKPCSTLMLAWQAVRARTQQHMATRRNAFEERMSQRSSRATSARIPDHLQVHDRMQAPSLYPTCALLCCADLQPVSCFVLQGPSAGSGLAAERRVPPSFCSMVANYGFEFRWHVRQVRAE